MEIDEMQAGPELDALVGEFMGEPKCDRHHTYGECFHGFFGKPYSTDIAAAWEVLEKLRDLDMFCDLTASYYDPVRKRWTKWTVELNDKDDSKFEDDSAPLAICRAALKATASESRTPAKS